MSSSPSASRFTGDFGEAEGSVNSAFSYRGCHFVCSAVPRGPETFDAFVLYQHGIAGLEQMALPQDSGAYAGAAEALRHAQQQAVRWVHDRTGEGTGQF